MKTRYRHRARSDRSRLAQKNVKLVASADPEESPRRVRFGNLYRSEWVGQNHSPSCRWQDHGMARGDKTLMFFMTRPEINIIVADLVASGAEALVSADNKAATVLRSDDLLPASSQFVYIGYPDLSHGDVASVLSNPGAHAWARLLCPPDQPGDLYQADLGIRTISISHDNPNGVEVFRRAAKPFRKLLSRPTWAWNIVHGGAHAYRDLGFSPGAKEFFDAGGSWLQRGVANVRFGPEEPAVAT